MARPKFEVEEIVAVAEVAETTGAAYQINYSLTELLAALKPAEQD